MNPARPSYVVRAVLASGALYFVLDLSRADRGAVDWIVIALVVGAIGWNLVQLGRRLFSEGGGRALWHMQRTLLFWVIGLLNTALARPEAVGTWKYWTGWALVLIALVDTVALFQRERRGESAPSESG